LEFGFTKGKTGVIFIETGAKQTACITVNTFLVQDCCQLSEQSVVVTDGLYSRMGHRQTQQKHDKLPQNGKCFIHKASDVATKQPGSQPAVWVRFSNKYTTTEKLILSIS